ncbi:MAG: TadE/TadG family type IV pilus assembly protein [Pseudomonadota bacterium]
MQSLKRFEILKRDQRGMAAIEFAFAAPVILLLIIGAVEFGWILFANSTLESAVREASRRGLTGYAPCDMSREEYIAAVIDNEMGSFSDPDKRTVTQTVYDNFNQLDGEPFSDINENGIRDANEDFTDINGNLEYDADLGAAGLGNAGAVVVYEVSYELDNFSSWFARKIGSENGFSISASATVRNEPAAIDGSFGGNVDDCDLEEPEPDPEDL